MSSPNPAAVLPRHRLPIALLNALADGRFDENALGAIRSAERSRRMVLLRGVCHYARGQSDGHGPLPSVEDAWNLLLSSESANRQVVEEMLADPQIGLWLGHTLRRLRNVTDDVAPLWFHVGQLHSMAVSSALRAGVNASMTVPVWNGVVVLPSLGHFRLPVEDEWTQAEVIVDGGMEIRCGGTVTKVDPRSEETTNTWFPAKRVSLSAGGRELSICLDDFSPYRGQEKPRKPEPLTAEDVDRWQELLAEAWALLVRDHTDRADELAIGMASITALPAAFRFRPRSISTDDGFGAAILSEPFDAAQLAVTLVHEFQHSVLNGIRHLAELVDGDDPPTGYAPWRDDPRPLGGLIHGVFAFTAIAEFYAIHRRHTSGVDADFANFELALWRSQASLVLDKIRKQPAWTEIGARFLDGIAGRLDRLKREEVPSEIAALADTAAVDHDTSWRACHLRPDPNRVEDLVAAWATGQPAPAAAGYPQPAVQKDLSGQRLDAKAALMRVKLTDPELFSRLRAEPDLVPGASPADVAFVAGDLESARHLYLEELSQAPTRGPGWSGLALTLAALGERDTAQIVQEQPETLRALASTWSGADQPAPDELATWLSRKQQP